MEFNYKLCSGKDFQKHGNQLLKRGVYYSKKYIIECFGIEDFGSWKIRLMSNDCVDKLEKLSTINSWFNSSEQALQDMILDETNISKLAFLRDVFKSQFLKNYEQEAINIADSNPKKENLEQITIVINGAGRIND